MELITDEIRAVADAIRIAAEQWQPEDTNQSYYDRVAAAAIRALERYRAGAMRGREIRPGLDRELRALARERRTIPGLPATLP
jgi:hypothetical protein